MNASNIYTAAEKILYQLACPHPDANIYIFFQFPVVMVTEWSISASEAWPAELWLLFNMEETCPERSALIRGQRRARISLFIWYVLRYMLRIQKTRSKITTPWLHLNHLFPSTRVMYINHFESEWKKNFKLLFSKWGPGLCGCFLHIHQTLTTTSLKQWEATYNKWPSKL